MNLENEEKIYTIRRAHPIILFFRIIPFLFISAFVLFLIVYLFYGNVEFKLHEGININPNYLYIIKNLKYYLILLLLLALPFIWLSLFLNIIYYYLTFWIITDRKILFASFRGLFDLKYAALSYDRIQNVTTRITGPLESILGFGDLTIETAAMEGKFIMEKIPEPEIVKQIIFETKIDYYKKYGEKSD
jgi:uncharacterized membrane protein YdbT with pleckstrin-like domain